MLRLTALEAFRREHRGPVLVAGDVAYDRARMSFNALVDARPEVIVRPTGPADVATALRFAAAEGLPRERQARAMCDRTLKLMSVFIGRAGA